MGKNGTYFLGKLLDRILITRTALYSYFCQLLTNMSTIVHIDCNAFFASCEIATRPQLQNTPVIVANSNEAGGGVILALNDKAKALGLKRGTPLFKIKHLLSQYAIQVCPADHKKYHRISRQIMQIVIQQGIILNFQQYSIDEFFGTLPIDDPSEIRIYIQMVKDAITTGSNIPVSCGCSSTYTLAKIATHYAKHYSGYKGICILTPDKRQQALSRLPVADVWGIGRSLQKKMASLNILTAWDFACLPLSRIQTDFGTQGLHTWQELHGVSSIKIHKNAQQQSIMQSHSFPYMLSSLPDLQKAVCNFAGNCSAKLRAQHSICRSITLFVNTNRHRKDLAQYSNTKKCKLTHYSNDTSLITKTSLELLRQIYRSGYQYKQAGLILSDIISDQGRQLDLFDQNDYAKKNQLMKTIDSINAKFGDDTIHLAVQDNSEKNTNTRLKEEE